MPGVDALPLMPWLLLPAERAALRRYFVKALCSLQRMDLYWCAERRRIVVRSPLARKRHAIPPGAKLVGTYAHPFPADDFLGDLDDTLAKYRPEAGAARA